MKEVSSVVDKLHQTYDETSYGIIPLIKKDDKWHVLMVQHRAGHWAFPKGHPHPHELPEETAEREFHEETGLSLLKWLPLDPVKEEYTFVRKGENIRKLVVYYFALVNTFEKDSSLQIKVQPEEIQEARVVTITDAAGLATFSEMKRLCEHISKIVEEISSS